MAAVDRIQVLLRASRLVSEEYQPHFLLTNEKIRSLRELSYIEQWEKSIAEKLFNVRLADHSLVVFQESDSSCSYSYLHSPINVPTFEKFLLAKDLENSARNRDEFRDDFELAIISADRKENITPIRYDYDPQGYNKGSHPIGHIHIGLDNQVRIGFNRKMNKVSFLLFLIRQMYPENWRLLIEHREADNLNKYLRSECTSIDKDFWSELDSLEHHLT
ncbi:MAG: DUF2290 domain-containing protein [Comamonas sp.]|jgi:hypothetical protein|nr:DUF2290 domain-containing protein [Comamonas sp.]